MKTEQSEVTLESLDQLALWYQQKKIQDHHYVYHPVLEKWMYVKDLESSNPSEQPLPELLRLHRRSR